MAAWNTNALDNFMVSKLYQVQTASSEPEDKVVTEKLARSPWPRVDQYLLSWVPTPFQFCKKRDKDKQLAMARSKLTKEINMVQLIQDQRYYKKALSLLLSKKQLDECQTSTEFILIDPRAPLNFSTKLFKDQETVELPQIDLTQVKNVMHDDDEKSVQIVTPLANVSAIKINEEY